MRCILARLCLCILFAVLLGNSLSAQQNTAEKLKEWLRLATEYRFNKPDTARDYCQKILADPQVNATMKAEALRIISISHEAQGDYREALDNGLKSLELWREIGDNAKTANALNSVGIIYDQQGNFHEALRYYNEAYDIYKELNDDEHLAMMNINLGILFKSQGQYEQVLRHYKDAYATYLRLKSPAEIAFCEANLGSVYYYTGQYDSCVYYSLKAEQALHEQQNLQFMPVAQANAGIGYLALGRLPEAGMYLQKSLDAHKQYGNKKETSFVLIQLARMYTQKNQPMEAYRSLSEAKALALSINSPQQAMEASRLLADHYQKEGDYKRAYDEFVHYSVVKDTLFAQQKTREIANHQVRYETEKKEQEIILLTQKNKIQQLDISQRNLYLFIAALLIAGSVTTIWLNNRYRKIKEEKLKQEASMQAELLKLEARNALQQDRLRISRDLHDNIGSNLTFIHTNLDSMNSSGNTRWQDIKTLVTNTISELRRTVWLINKPSVSLEEWLIKLREYFSTIGKIEVVASEMKEERLLFSRQATALFRIVQEAVNNSLKYANASHIRISVTEGILVTIEDNGKGFDKTHVAKGFGLDNMKQNAEEAGGTINIDSVPGQGTRVYVHLPLEKIRSNAYHEPLSI